MKIGCLKERKDNESRVGLTPWHVKDLRNKGHELFIENEAGSAAGFCNSDYLTSGAALCSPFEVIKNSELIIKVKEPIPFEYEWFDNFKSKTLFTYLHLANAGPGLVDCLLRNNITGISYDTIEDVFGSLPLLKPMSQIAGTLSIQYAAEFLQKKYGGPGITLGYSNILVLGAGSVGFAATELALGMGANVNLFDIKRKGFPERINFYDDPTELPDLVRKADVVIGAALVNGQKAPQVLDQELLKNLKSGSIIIDVAIDQGGCIWGSKPTSHSNPIYRLNDHIYCCIPNMPGQVPREATEKLTEVTYPHILNMANKGIETYFTSDPGLFKGINTHRGKLINKTVAKALGMEGHSWV
jgi:alanine dehydrogenase